VRYERIVSYVASSLWAILPEKIDEIVSVLAFRAAGHVFSADEIQARIGGRRDGATTPAPRGVAVIPIHGTIAHRGGGMDESSGGTSTERIGAMLNQVAGDERIGTIVYDVDSPGGTVTGVAELAAKMHALKGQKRQIAHVNGMAGSAAYWLASQADEIASIPSGVTGSIGVFMVHQSMAKALEQEGIDVSVISAGKYKVEGNPFQPLSDEARAHMEQRVQGAYRQFVQDVALGRGVAYDDVANGYGEGRALVAPDALKAGLIDRIGSLDETLARVTGRTAHSMRAEADRFRYA
jgi:signal peptide peptidase SppA